MKHVAIIGAGLAGLTLANILKSDAKITIFEKARGVSGRMATRRAESNCSEPYYFDHGAQYFTVKTEPFQKFINPMIQAGIVKPWHARFAEIKDGNMIQRKQWDDAYPHYVGTPNMNSIAKYLQDGLDVKLQTRVQTLHKTEDGKWLLSDDNGNMLGEYDWVVSAIPAPQAVDILPPNLPFYDAIKSVQMKGCYSVMLGFDDALPLEFDAALIHDEAISWISTNHTKPRRNAKPDRNTNFCLLVHANNDWADARMEYDQTEIMAELCQNISALIKHDVGKASHKALHRWRYANIGTQNGQDYLLDAQENIGVCGDWLIKGRVESAFTSGYQLAHQILPNLQSSLLS